MNLQVMAIFDEKARAFKTPFFVAHVDLGMRAIADAVNNAPESDLYKFPEDFTVWHFGSFDDGIGSFTLPKPVQLAMAIQLKKGPVRGPGGFPTPAFLAEEKEKRKA